MKLKNLIKEEKLIESIRRTFNGVMFNVRFIPDNKIINIYPTSIKDMDNIDKEKTSKIIESYLSMKFKIKLAQIRSSDLYGFSYKLYDMDIEELILRYLK